MINAKLKKSISDKLKEYQKEELFMKSPDGAEGKKVVLFYTETLKNIIRALDFREIVYNTIKNWIGTNLEVMAYIDMIDGSLSYGLTPPPSNNPYNHFVNIFKLEPGYFEKMRVENYILLDYEKTICEQMIVNGEADDIYEACKMLDINLTLEYTNLLVKEFHGFNWAKIENQISQIKIKYYTDRYGEIICPVYSIANNDLHSCKRKECGLWKTHKYEQDGCGCELTYTGLYVPLLDL